MTAFLKQVSEFATKAKISNERVMRGATIKLFSSVIMASPVDSGRFRANWQLSGSAPASGVTSGNDTGGATASSVAQEVASSAQWQEFTLANNLPYAAKLEFGGYPGDGPKTAGGFSTQAPRGMVRVNVARFDAIVEQMARAQR